LASLGAGLVSIVGLFVIVPTATALPGMLGSGFQDMGAGVLLEKLIWFAPVFLIVAVFARRAPGVRAFATRADRRLFVWGAGLVTMIVLYLIIRLAQGPDSDTFATLKDMGFFKSDLKDVLQVLAIGCVGPVAEEFIFRGLIYRSVRDFGIRASGRFGGSPRLWYWLSIALALVISGYTFLQIHTGTPVLYFLMATAFAGVYEFTGSLQAASFAHALNNSAVMLLAAASAGAGSLLMYAVCVACPFLALALTRLVGRAIGDDNSQIATDS